MIQKMELIIDYNQAHTLIEEGWTALRPDLVEYADMAAKDLRERIMRKFKRFGRGRLYRRRGVAYRASAPGEPPAIQSERYLRSFDTDTRSLKKSVHGRVGSALWYIGRVLEYGNRWIKPRPHIGPAFDEWRRDLNRQL